MASAHAVGKWRNSTQKSGWTSSFLAKSLWISRFFAISFSQRISSAGRHFRTHARLFVRFQFQFHILPLFPSVTRFNYAMKLVEVAEGKRKVCAVDKRIILPHFHEKKVERKDEKNDTKEKIKFQKNTLAGCWLMVVGGMEGRKIYGNL